MPDFIVTSPDGTKYRVTAPEGATEDQAIAYVQGQHAPQNKSAETQSKPQTSALEAGARGLAAGATANWFDEMAGLGAAGPIQYLYEKVTGKPGEATKAYDAVVKRARENEEKARKEHPYAFGAGELAGGVGSSLLFPGRAAGTLAGRAAQGAVQGGLYGAAAGAGAGQTPQERITGAATGGVAGAALGGAAVPAAEGVGLLAGHAAAPVINTVRSLRNPQGQAALTAAQALERDQPQIAAGKAQGMTPAQFKAAKAAGEPVMLADMGGSALRGTARAFANVSPEARDIMESAAQNRYKTQNLRGEATVRDLISGGPNAAKTAAHARVEYDMERISAYRKAYEQGDRPITSPTLERLMSAPFVSDALKAAIPRWKNWAVEDGYGSMNPPIKITPDGRIEFNRAGKMVYPNLQWWDYASRIMSGAAAKARDAGDTEEAKLYGSLAGKVKAELDHLVPSFGNARGIAAKYFGVGNVQQAAEKAFQQRSNIRALGDPAQLKLVMAKMTPAEREIFQEKYADLYMQQMRSTADNQNLTTRLMRSPQERQLMGAIFGPSGAAKLDALKSREEIYDSFRRVFGNSTTARQLVELGLTGAAGGGLGYLTGHDWRATALMGAAGRAGYKYATNYATREVAIKFAELITSDDPGKLAEGLKMAAENKRLAEGLRAIANRVASLGAATAAPAAASAAGIGPQREPLRLTVTPGAQTAQRGIYEQ